MSFNKLHVPLSHRKIGDNSVGDLHEIIDSRGSLVADRVWAVEAETIVKACNSFDALTAERDRLREALREAAFIVRTLANGGDFHEKDLRVIDEMARAALGDSK